MISEINLTFTLKLLQGLIPATQEKHLEERVCAFFSFSFTPVWEAVAMHEVYCSSDKPSRDKPNSYFSAPPTSNKLSPAAPSSQLSVFPSSTQLTAECVPQ